MPSRVLARSLLAASLTAMLLPLVASPASGDPSPADADVIPGRYIVGFRQAVDSPAALSNNLENAEGFQTQLRYRHALKGFGASLTRTQVERLRQHPKVAFVVPDREVHATGTQPVQGTDFVPTGIRRYEAGTTTEVHTASSVNVAVIDTGIDLNHPDLDNAVNGKDCIDAEPAQDDNGHGTHVAGTIAAENDGAGVVGAAPGTKLWAVKVLSKSGSGAWSQVICGIDWATGTRTDGDPSNNIAVANMSLGGGGSPLQSCATTSDLLHRAICNSTNAGVTYVVAAGNDGWDFDFVPNPDVPAAYPQVLTVTAVSDSDGLPGGVGGGPTCSPSHGDDRHATWSNYAATSAGQAHTIAGPGVCIKSDWPGGGTNTISGTSMATPHIAGLVALCLDVAAPEGCGGLQPADIIQKVRADAAAYNTSNPGYGFYGDPDAPVSGRYYGWLARVGMAPPPPPPPPPQDETAPTVTGVTPSNGATGVSALANVSVNFSEAMNQTATEGAFSLTPAAGGSALAGSLSWSGNTMTFDPTDPLAQGTDYTATVATAATDTAGNALAENKVWSFQTLTPDETAPTVTDVSPDNGATGVSASANVSVTFSEAMNQTATQGAFSLTTTGGSSVLDGSFSWSGNTMTFNPTASLAQGTDYTATVTTAATDSAGNALAGNEAWSFHTLTNVTAYPNAVSPEPGGGTPRSGDHTRLISDNNSYYEVYSTTSGTRTTSWIATFDNVPNDLDGLKVTYKGRNSRTCTQVVSIRKDDGSWTQLDSQSVGDSERLIERTPATPFSNYVSGTSGDGQLVVKVRCTRSSSSFYSRGDLMKIVYTRP